MKEDIASLNCQIMITSVDGWMDSRKKLNRFNDEEILKLVKIVKT